jgi:hypothetical protein
MAKSATPRARRRAPTRTPPATVTAAAPSRMQAAESRLVRVPWFAVVVPFVVLFVALSLAQPVPVYMPDEPLYTHLARSIAGGEGYTWRGSPVSLNSALYVYLITPVWLVASGARAYELAKIETVCLSCLVAVPVWMLARQILSHQLALLAVALSLAGTWMVTPQGVMTEGAGLPLATACLVCVVQALRHPSSRRWAWLALCFALVAAWARMQLIVLAPIVVLALVADVARAGAGWRARLDLHRAPLAGSGGVLLLGVIVLAVAGSSFTGGYSGILHFHADAAGIARASGQELLQLAAMCGFVPLALLVMLAGSRVAWRDEVVGPLLATLVPAVLVLTLQNGFYVSGSGVQWPIQRYMSYVAPVLLLFCLAALTRDQLVRRRTFAGAGLLSLLVALTPDVVVRPEGAAVFTTTEALQTVVPDVPTGAALAVVAVALCLAGLGVLASGRRSRIAAIMGGALLAVLLIQTSIQSGWQIGYTRAVRADLPADVAWVDHHSPGPVAVLEITRNWDDFFLVDFFNADIAQFFVLDHPPRGAGTAGRACGWHIQHDGRAQFDDGCGAPVQTFFVNDPTGHLTFYDEVSSASSPKLGRIVTVRGRPRVRSLVTTACPRKQVILVPVIYRPYPSDTAWPCDAQVDLTTWLNRPGTVLVGIRGAPFADHAATVGGRSFVVKAGSSAVVRVPMGPGRHHAVVGLDWAQRSPTDPEVTSVELEQDGRRSSLL